MKLNTPVEINKRNTIIKKKSEQLSISTSQKLYKRSQQIWQQKIMKFKIIKILTQIEAITN